MKATLAPITLALTLAACGGGGGTSTKSVDNHSGAVVPPPVVNQNTNPQQEQPKPQQPKPQEQPKPPQNAYCAGAACGVVQPKPEPEKEDPAAVEAEKVRTEAFFKLFNEQLERARPFSYYTFTSGYVPLAMRTTQEDLNPDWDRSVRWFCYKFQSEAEYACNVQPWKQVKFAPEITTDAERRWKNKGMSWATDPRNVSPAPQKDYGGFRGDNPSLGAYGYRKVYGPFERPFQNSMSVEDVRELRKALLLQLQLTIDVQQWYCVGVGFVPINDFRCVNREIIQGQNALAYARTHWRQMVDAFMPGYAEDVYRNRYFSAHMCQARVTTEQDVANECAYWQDVGKATPALESDLYDNPLFETVGADLKVENLK